MTTGQPTAFFEKRDQTAPHLNDEKTCPSSPQNMPRPPRNTPVSPQKTRLPNQRYIAVKTEIKSEYLNYRHFPLPPKNNANKTRKRNNTSNLRTPNGIRKNKKA